LSVFRTAGRIGALGLKEAMRSTRPGMYEYQIAAVAEFIYSMRGPRGPFFPISDPPHPLPHYSANRRKMEDGDIVVMTLGLTTVISRM
jgi:Xaa-Pro aminopeptidase